MHSIVKSLALGLLASASLVAGHCKISAVTGDLGGKGTGLGIDPTGDPNSESDVTVFQGSQAKTFGETPGGGNINPATALTAMIADTGPTLPQVSVGGVVKITLHQVNADGAGPFTCTVDPTAKGTAFQAATITTNVAGNDGISTAANEDFPLTVSMPAGLKCTGTVSGQANLCFVKCQNPKGPFGGVVPVQMGAGSGTAATATSATTAATATSATAAAEETSACPPTKA